MTDPPANPPTTASSKKRRRRRRRRRRRPSSLNRREAFQRGIFILPNLITTGGMACGFYAIIKAIQGDFVIAAYLIILAALFDTFDGRVARMTKTTSAFGMQYDSLADLASFGIAPAVLLYQWGLQAMEPNVGWIAAFLFFVCGALRLARYNVQSIAGTSSGRHFTGLTIPFAASTVSSTVILHNYLWDGAPVQSPVILVLVFGLAFLMVSTVPFRSFKDFNLRTQRSFQALVVMVMVALLIMTNPAIMLFICATSYIFAGIFTELWRRYRRLVARETRAVDKVSTE